MSRGPLARQTSGGAQPSDALLGPRDAPSDDLGIALVWRQRRLRSVKPGRSFSLTFQALNRLNII